MTSLTDYDSIEKEILINIFDKINGCDKWIASIIESYLYPYFDYTEIYDGKIQKYDIRFGKRNGPFKVYSIKNNKEILLIESNYKNGEISGEYKYYYTSCNQLMKHCFFLNGQQNGESKFWHNNGQLRSHCFYHLNKLHGECKYWSTNGQLYSHCLYDNGIVVKDLLSS